MNVQYLWDQIVLPILEKKMEGFTLNSNHFRIKSSKVWYFVTLNLVNDWLSYQIRPAPWCTYGFHPMALELLWHFWTHPPKNRVFFKTIFWMIPLFLLILSEFFNHFFLPRIVNHFVCIFLSHIVCCHTYWKKRTDKQNCIRLLYITLF